ncbi:unnamed protein product [Boreogadus saida]
MPPVPSPRPVALRPRVSDSVDASDTSAALQLSSSGPQSRMGVGTRTLEVSEEEPGAVMELSNPALNVLTKQRPANTPPASLADPASCSAACQEDRKTDLSTGTAVTVNRQQQQHPHASYQHSHRRQHTQQGALPPSIGPIDPPRAAPPSTHGRISRECSPTSVILPQ